MAVVFVALNDTLQNLRSELRGALGISLKSSVQQQELLLTCLSITCRKED